jgi:L-threonylcarbamoyladenylate synthase
MPRKITSDTGKVAVRWPKNRVVQALLDELDEPLTGTSANFAGAENPVSAADVQIQLGDRVPLILDGGESTVTQPSTIVDVGNSGWRIVREGAIPAEEIEEFFQG